MLVKVCGITRKKQLDALDNLGIEMVGLNFYPSSKRYIEEPLLNTGLKAKRVGVFVNPTVSEVIKLVSQHSLDYVQLHGNEPLEVVAELANRVPIIKAFGVAETFDFEVSKPYEPYVEYFLFDTLTPFFGGSGQKFNWQKLAEYKGGKSFLLSGGIQPEDAKMLGTLEHKRFAGIDINSGFEDSPGVKNIELIKSFLSDIKHEKSR